MKIGKWNSRKLLVTLIAGAVGFFYPPLVPFLVKVVPTYVGIQGIVDAVKAYRNHPGV